MQNNIEQIDNNDALKEDVKDPNQELLDEMEENKKMEGVEQTSVEGEEAPVEKEVQEKDIKEDMVDVNDPEKEGRWAEHTAYHTSEHGNTFGYDDTSKKAGDFKEAVDNKKQNVEQAVNTTEDAEDELKAIQKKEAEVNAETQVEVPQEEVQTPENPVPEGEEEYVQMNEVKTEHEKQMLAFQREDEYIDNETAEKLNTLAA